jgi:UDP-N-acetylglucosamine diphosphorylase / glucose-1-phosphate thymidylyltransferase / UDP-N-acetylgalactosamine diphosphorylase / glucosamine-1-phosphate N-acetyltransferase / galactosamine-1-phosphate N-acetyltransferase
MPVFSFHYLYQMQCIVFAEADGHSENLFPFTLTRFIQDIRVGILTIREKWEQLLQLPSFNKYEGKYKDNSRSVKIDQPFAAGNFLLLNAGILPDTALVEAIKNLLPGQTLCHLGAGEIAKHCVSSIPGTIAIAATDEMILFNEPVMTIRFPWDIFAQNDLAIRRDYALLTANRTSAQISDTNRLTRKENIFLEAGVIIEHCIINASTGPVYLAQNTTVMEGTIIRGPFALLPNAVVKMGAKIYGATTIGPNSTAGGEIKNSVLMGNSNKAHDGYLGDSVIGEWCNIGAGSSASNVKNNAGEVQLHQPFSASGKLSAGFKCGLLMGDYSRAAIQSAFNTGTVAGVSCSIFGKGLLPKYIPNFSWGVDNTQRYIFEKALTDIHNWKKLKEQSLTSEEETILKYIYENY